VDDPPVVAVLDASALYPAVLCDTLLSVAQAGIYVPVWSEDILAELVRNLGPRIGDEAAQRRIQEMRIAFPEASAADYQDLISVMTNHPKDRHVVAAAVVHEANRIVTVNLRDFPPAALSPLRIAAKSPDEFLSDLFADSPEEIQRTLEQQAARYRRLPMAVVGLLGELTKHAPQFVAEFRRWNE
jgi:hypothetical protein